ncbi:MAG: hypothetical protein R3A52_02290 [Polyangiales bacterium]
MSIAYLLSGFFDLNDARATVRDALRSSLGPEPLEFTVDPATGGFDLVYEILSVDGFTSRSPTPHLTNEGLPEHASVRFTVLDREARYLAALRAMVSAVNAVLVEEEGEVSLSMDDTLLLSRRGKTAVLHTDLWTIDERHKLLTVPYQFARRR